MVSMELNRLYEENAPKLVGFYISKNPKLISFFDSREDMQQHLLLAAWKATLQYNGAIAKYSTFIFACIKNSMRRVIRKANSPAHKGNVISMEEYISETLKIEDTLASEEDLSEMLERKEKLNFIVKHLSPEAYDYYVNGLKQREIAENYATSQTMVCRKIKRNIKTIKNMFEK